MWSPSASCRVRYCCGRTAWMDPRVVLHPIHPEGTGTEHRVASLTNMHFRISVLMTSAGSWAQDLLHCLKSVSVQNSYWKSQWNCTGKRRQKACGLLKVWGNESAPPSLPPWGDTAFLLSEGLSNKTPSWKQGAPRTAHKAWFKETFLDHQGLLPQPVAPCPPYPTHRLSRVAEGMPSLNMTCRHLSLSLRPPLHKCHYCLKDK